MDSRVPCVKLRNEYDFREYNFRITITKSWYRYIVVRLILTSELWRSAIGLPIALPMVLGILRAMLNLTPSSHLGDVKIYDSLQLPCCELLSRKLRLISSYVHNNDSIRLQRGSYRLGHIKSCQSYLGWLH